MSDLGLQNIFNRLADNLAKDALVQTKVNNLRDDLQVDRVVLYTISIANGKDKLPLSP